MQDILVPDLAGWRRKRIRVVVTDVPYFDLAPDWVSEVISPSLEKYDRSDKLSICVRDRVG